MSEKRPILVVQMQRMGDLILSYPLMLWLSRRYPGHPVWVMAEEIFYREMMQISPAGVTYFPWTEASLNHLRSRGYHLVVNLSHDPRAAELAGQVKSEEVYGPVCDKDGSRYIRGDWQLYRASLTRSNRHNRFHWADLNALDCVPLADIAATSWGEPRVISDVASRKVGLFLGASQREKRPGAAFWATLGRELLERGMRPVLLGGPGEVGLAKRVAADIPAKVINFAGQQTLAEFAYIGQTLGLLVTPDTGPMHLAAWSGLRVLNLSMGNVNCWETGPYQTGHTVLRARVSCAGCWDCTRESPLCQGRFLPRQVAYLAQRANARELERFRRRPVAGLELFGTGRDRHGLYTLERFGPAPASVRDHLGGFWQHYWGARFGLWGLDEAHEAFTPLRQGHPKLRDAMRQGLARLSRDLKKGLAPGAGRKVHDDFWRTSSPALQPARSYCQLSLENADGAPRAWAACLELVEQLLSVME